MSMNLQSCWQLMLQGQISEDDFVKYVEGNKPVSGSQNLFVKAINMALESDAVRLSRKLAQRGFELYPDNDFLRRASIVLAPPKVVSTSQSSSFDDAASLNWIRTKSGQYVGKWVALQNGVLLGAASSWKMLNEQLGNNIDLKDVLITRIL